jgi:ankyrin repeat protein
MIWRVIVNKYLSVILVWHTVGAQPTIPFIGTVKLGSRKLVAQHLATGKAPVNMHDELGNTPLHYAVNLDSYEITQLLLEHHAQVNARNNAQTTPLHIAVRHRNTRIVHLLLTFGADANSLDATGTSPLHLTASYAHMKCGLEIIELLRTHGAHTAICNNEQKTPHACIIDKHATLQSPHPVHRKNLTSAATLLHPDNKPQQAAYEKVHRSFITCAKTTNIKKMRTLLNHPHININAQHGPLQRSALMQAIRNNRCDIAQLLIDAGIDTSLRDINGLTALDYARIYNRPTILRTLEQRT